MIRKYRLLSAIGVLISLSILACKSTPPRPASAVTPPPATPPSAPPAQPDPLPPVSRGGQPQTGTADQEPPDQGPSDQEPPDQGTLDALTAAAAKVEEARSQALVFDGAEYDPQNWADAESRYQAAGSQVKKTTQGEALAAIAFYTQLSQDYDSIFDTAIPLYAKAREDEITQARSEAIDAGVLDLSPERLGMADDQVLQAVASYEAKDYFPAAKSALRGIDMYRGLKVGCQAYAMRMEIEDNGFQRYDTENYNQGDAVFRDAVAAYDVLEIDEALMDGEEAYLRYNLVWNTGWKNYAAERGNAATEERSNALNLKANVAVRDDFDAASDIYNRAQISYNAERFVDAADLYFQSEFLFAAVCSVTQEKRQIAEDAIKTAEAKTAASDETARRAEELLQGGTR